jgi:uncharacterized membrane protein YbhN (UPF0104 family)
LAPVTRATIRDDGLAQDLLFARAMRAPKSTATVSCRGSRRAVRAAWSAAGVVTVVVAAGLALRRLDGAALRSALTDVSLAPLALAMALNLVGRTAARTLRTRLLLGGLPAGAIRLQELVRLQLCGYAAGALLPGPAEEALCTARLVRRHGFQLRDLLTVHALDKSIGVLSVLLIALPILPGAGRGALPLCAAALVALAVLAIGVLRARRGAAAAGSRVAGALALLVASNLLSVAMVALCLAAVGVHLGVLGCLQVFVASACASAVPLTPGQVGVVESAFVLALGHLGVAPAPALAAGLLYRLAQMAPLVAAGLPMLLEMPWRRAPATAQQAPAINLECASA